MKNKLEPLPLKSEGNGSNIAQISVDKADIPMLVHALAIGANTVMMCGGGNAQRRMRHYKKVLEDMVSPGWKHFRFEEDVSNIVLAINETPTCRFQFKKKYWEERGVVEITVGDKVWNTFTISISDALEMLTFVKEILPLSCELEIAGDIPE